MSASRHNSSSPPSPSFSARSPSPLLSPDIEADLDTWYSTDEVDISASHPESPVLSESQAAEYEVESVTCLWENCGQPFSQLQALIDHIHNEHIGMNKSIYTCEWATCSRRGIQQASRFALISHIRAHTGEKPYTCSLPECDKSFTRSDAKAKHMRLQHNMPAPLPGRGGPRKRKRDESEYEGMTQPAFKVDGQASADLGMVDQVERDELGMPAEDDQSDHLDVPPVLRSVSPGAVSTGSSEDRDDGIPEYLLQQMEPRTGRILGRSPTMVRYLIVKAKHRFALQQQEHLLEELRVMRAEEQRARELKEEALDQVLRLSLGPQAEFLIQQLRL